MSRRQVWVSAAVLALVALCGCAPARPAVVRAAIDRYRSAPGMTAASHASETEQFWFDAQILYADSLLNGNPESFRALLALFADADGAVGEGMPALRHVVRQWPSMAKGVIGESAAFSKQYGYLLRPDKDEE